MTAKIIKDNTIPSNWKRIVTRDHKYIAIIYGNGKSIYYEVYHSDDCTMNNRQHLFNVKGNIALVCIAIGKYEAEQEVSVKDKNIIDQFCKIGIRNNAEYLQKDLGGGQ